MKGHLGTESPRLYLYCIYQVVLLLEKLYKESWVLGDLCASNVFVECQTSDIKVNLLCNINIDFSCEAAYVT